MLRPGLQLLRRDVRTLQVGLDWPGVGALHETPAVRAVLAAVDGFRDAEGVLLAAVAHDVPASECAAAYDLLVDGGVLVDQGSVRRSGPDDPATAASWLLSGPGGDPSTLAQARRAARVLVQGEGQVRDVVSAQLDRVGLAVTSSDTDATLTVLAFDREPDRARSDQAMHSGLPHTWVHVRDLVGVVGPFVVPGEHPCLRCVDAARGDLDPAWPTVVESAVARPLNTPACDPLLAQVVGTWAAQEVSLWVAGLRPHGLGRVVELPLGFGVVGVEEFATHPQCGCGWPIWQDTMGA